MRKFRPIAVILICAVLLATLPAAPAQGAEPELESKSAVLIDSGTGQILFEKNSHQRQAPASVTKIMTLLVCWEAVAAGKASLTDQVETSENAWKLGGSQIWLEPGEKMSLQDLLMAIAVGSANDACVAAGEHIFGSHEGLVAKMNEKAAELGLQDTHFVNAYGFSDPNHYTTAYDMAQIGRQLLKYPTVMQWVGTKVYDIRGGEPRLFNRNKLLWWYQGADGFKTGWTTEAGYCLASTVERDGLRLVACTLGSSRIYGNFRDSMKLYDYGFKKYAFKQIAPAGQICGTVKVSKGDAAQVEAIAPERVGAMIVKGAEQNITSQVELPAAVDAPVKKGQKIGEIVILKGDQEISRLPLVAKEDIKRGALGQQILRMLKTVVKCSCS